MEYNIEYIDREYALMNIFLIDAQRNVLDVSYSITDTNLVIQIILLDGSRVPDAIMQKTKESFPSYNVTIKQQYISKEKYNENVGDWSPKYYEWLDNLLFSKAEVL